MILLVLQIKNRKIIIGELQKAHPNYGIITEESGIINKNNTQNRWIIDPIDGTTNFLMECHILQFLLLTKR